MQSIQNTVFTPQLSARADAEHIVKTGTTTIGLVCKDCIILAADKRATAGSMIVHRDENKVKAVSKHIAVTTAGSVSDLQLLFKYLKAELKVKELRSGREPSVKEGASLLAAWVYQLIRTSYGVVHFLVGGYDSEPRLFDVYPDGSLMAHKDFIVSGSGSVFALGVIESRYKAGMTKEQGVQLALDSISVAMSRDSASGNGIDVLVIDKDGATMEVKKFIPK